MIVTQNDNYVHVLEVHNVFMITIFFNLLPNKTNSNVNIY